MSHTQKTEGLTSAEAKTLLQKYGRNEPVPQKKQSFFVKALHIIAEPMFMLLIAAAVIYFFLGEPRDGAIMLIFVVGMITIEIVQEWKTDRTLNALKDLSAPHASVIRDGRETVVPSAELVPGDVLLIQEGVKIPADGSIIRCSDLAVDESSLTGEAEAVWKHPFDKDDVSNDYWRRDRCYAGTLVTQGTAAVFIDKTGASTEYGKIGEHIAAAPDRPTPLEKQTGKLVRTCAAIAAVLFVLVGIVTWLNIPDHSTGDRLVESILSGITLAMAMIPEEFPVILTVFLSMGAWRLAKKNSLVRRLPSVETLGAVSVLCVDKTGTITMNQMRVREAWCVDEDDTELIETMGLACEVDTYDPMEKAMLDFCDEYGIVRGHLFSGSMICEYAFTNERKMMGHVWEHDGEIIIAAKGSPESIFRLCAMTDDEADAARKRAHELARDGLRVIAVGIEKPSLRDAIPEDLTCCSLKLLGLIGLADPPREGVREDIALCNRSGIRVVMITGDNGVTASAIARSVGMKDCDNIITGAMLDDMSDEDLCAAVRTASVFARVIPEHKMRIVKAFRDNGDIVAMTGDGVNDAPALKYADIGIAMGGRGSEVSREAADLILMDDNFSTIVETVRDGRRIYDNIRKAVGYVFTIHIPIALSSLLAPMLGISPDALLLLPLHVVLLELLIDPTCSIVLERQPAELDIMDRPPRDPKAQLLTSSVLIKSIIQGLAVFAASFGAYYLTLKAQPAAAGTARAMGLAVLMMANVFLVQENSSHIEPIWKSVLRLARDKVMWAVTLGTIALLIIIIYTPLASVLKLASLTAGQFFAAIGTAAASVLWYEIVKLVKRHKNK